MFCCSFYAGAQLALNIISNFDKAIAEAQSGSVCSGVLSGYVFTTLNGCIHNTHFGELMLVLQHVGRVSEDSNSDARHTRNIVYQDKPNQNSMLKTSQYNASYVALRT